MNTRTCDTCKHLFAEGELRTGLHYVCKGRPQPFRSPDAPCFNPASPFNVACTHYTPSACCGVYIPLVRPHLEVTTEAQTNWFKIFSDVVKQIP